MKKPSKTKASKDWVSFTQAQYEDAIDEMIHHSFKVTNSSITSGGVRVSKDQGLKLPYVSVVTQIGHGHEVLIDQYGRGPKNVTLHKQIIAVIENEAPDVPVDETQWIIHAVDRASQRPFVKCEFISPRLRQILIPKDGGYLSVSPLGAAGVGSLLAKKISEVGGRIDAMMKGGKKSSEIPYRRIKRAVNQIGGSNSINIGCLAYRLQSPILGAFPVAQSSLRHALSLHHKGQRSPFFPEGLVTEYTSWRNGLSGQYAKNQAARSEHEAFIKRFSRHWLGVGQDARDILLDHRDDLPQGADLVSAQLSVFDRGLICPELRDQDWKYQFASRLAKKVAVLEKDDKRLFEYSQSEINDIARIARDFLS